MIDGIKEIIIENPFYLRARMYDSQTASVLFEIAQINEQRTCRMYKFTIRRNHEQIYFMPEQNLTYWRNSLELKHLAVGDYRICAIICSEYDENSKNHSIPISTCVNIRVYRSHFLILTLYFLVILILAVSHINFTLRKREIRARIQSALIDAENHFKRWSIDQTMIHSQSYSIFPNSTPPIIDQSVSTQPVFFQLNN
jgi:hypothetical protein